MASFEELKLNRQLINATLDLDYQEPSEIQREAIPKILAGHDVLGIAQTGTGKTAAYLLPILMKIKYAQGSDPRALIFAPTRELCIQINDNIRSLAKYTDLRHTAVYGGTGMKNQIEAIHGGIDILVATPGRFMDIYLKGAVGVKQIKTLVLDEADKMMDMGFIPQIRRILEVIPSKRQNLLFSATFPEKIERWAEEFLEFPTRVEITPQATPVETVKQKLYKVPNLKTKINLLQYLLSDTETYSKVIIFSRTRKNADNIFNFIQRKIDQSVRVIHANKDQNARINAMDAFKDGEVRVLVSTDVAARGIDVSQVSHVINFDVPIVYEDYVHRIGRTGRAKNTGEAITFANKAEEYHIEEIEKIIQMAIPPHAIPPEVEIEKTGFEEKQEIDREIDQIRRKRDPEFKGAFHEKKTSRQIKTGKRKPGKRR